MLKEGDGNGNGKICYQMEMPKPISMQPITMQPISMQPVSMQPMPSTKQSWDRLSLSLSPYGSLQILIELNGETGFPVNEPYLQFAAGISTPIRRGAARGGRPAATGCVAGT